MKNIKNPPAPKAPLSTAPEPTLKGSFRLLKFLAYGLVALVMLLGLALIILSIWVP